MAGTFNTYYQKKFQGTLTVYTASIMKKILISLVILAVVGVGVYMVYHALMPALIAEATVSESLPGYIPKRLKTRIEAIKHPINQAAITYLTGPAVLFLSR